MALVKILIILLMGLSLFWLFYRLAKGGKGWKTFWFSAALGLLSLGVVWAIGRFHSEILQINGYTLGTATVLGIPGVILMVIVKMLWLL